MSAGDPPAILIENATLSDGDQVVCVGLSLSVPRGTIYALMGDARGRSALLQALRGRTRAIAGRLQILGLDPRSRWRLRSRRHFQPVGAPRRGVIAEAGSAEIILFENLRDPAHLREAAQNGKTVFLTTDDSAVAAASDRIGILARGRLVADEPLAALLARYRRIRFVNQATETRTAFGNELDEFHAVRVRVRGWGIEAIVSDFDEAAFDRFLAIEGVAEARAETLTLSEVLEAHSEAGS